MAIRFRAHMRFTPESGMGQWCVDQMQQRLTMAFHLREDDPNQELSYAVVDEEGSFRCNAFWPDDRQDLADDTQEQFSTLGPWLRDAVFDEDGNAIIWSWMDTHICHHDEKPPEPCENPYWTWRQDDE